MVIEIVLQNFAYEATEVRNKNGVKRNHIHHFAQTKIKTKNWYYLHWQTFESLRSGGAY